MRRLHATCSITVTEGTSYPNDTACVLHSSHNHARLYSRDRQAYLTIASSTTPRALLAPFASQVHGKTVDMVPTSCIPTSSTQQPVQDVLSIVKHQWHLATVAEAKRTVSVVPYRYEREVVVPDSNG